MDLNVLNGLVEALEISRGIVRQVFHDSTSEILRLRVQEMISLLSDLMFLLSSSHHQHRPGSSAVNAVNQIVLDTETLIEFFQGCFDGSEINRIDFLRNQASFQNSLCETGRPGRPSLIVVQEQVEGLRAIGMTWEKISELLGMTSRTLRNKRKEFKDFIDFDYSDISDNDLDSIVYNILEASPNTGERMLIGALRSRQIKIQRWKMRESIMRVDPVGRSMRRLFVIRRRKYDVKCPNALW